LLITKPHPPPPPVKKPSGKGTIKKREKKGEDSVFNLPTLLLLLGLQT